MPSMHVRPIPVTCYSTLRSLLRSATQGLGTAQGYIAVSASLRSSATSARISSSSITPQSDRLVAMGR